MLKKVENFHKTMEEIKPIPSSKDTLQARNNMVMSMNTDLRKTYFEFVTNFPEDVTLIDYKIERKPKGLMCEIHQNGSRINLDDIRHNFSDEGTTLENTKDRDNGSSMFGIGTHFISDSTKDYKISFRNEDGSFSRITRKTGKVQRVWLDHIPSEVMVVQTFMFKKTVKEDVTLINDWKEVIGITDMKAIVKGSKHTFDVKGFEDETLSGDVEPIKILWDYKDINDDTKPEFTTLFDKDEKKIKEVSVSDVYTNLGKKTSIKFNIDGFGKRVKPKNGLFNWFKTNTKDQPFMGVYTKGGRQQFMGFVPLRNLTGKWHLNHVMIESSVEKNDIKHFFFEPSKYEGFLPQFNDVVMKKFQSIIENTYKDDTVLESMYQQFIYGIIVYDKYGETVDKYMAEQHRKLFNLEWFNDLSIQKRKDCVTMEHWLNKDSRIDISIRYPKELNGTDEDLYTLIEMKRLNFNKSDITQSGLYLTGVKGCNTIYGVSKGITEKNRTLFDNQFKNMNQSNQLRLSSLTYGLIDLDDYGLKSCWENTQLYYFETETKRRELLKTN